MADGHGPDAAVAEFTMPPPEGSKGGRLGHLDALRGIAAFLVMVQHVLEIVANHPAAPGWYRAFAESWNLTYFSPGRAGVIAFFLISGFVVPFSLKQPCALRAFAISRFFRLYPAYWLSLFLSVTILPALGLIHFPARQVLANVTMLQFLLRQPDVIGAYWTLFIEMAFYGCCALWFLFGVLRSARFLAGMTIALLGLSLAAAFVRYHHPQAPLPVGYVSFLAAMHVGTLARLATLEGDALARRLLGPIVAIALVATIAISWLAYSQTPETDPWIANATGIFVGYALFFYCMIRKAFVSRFTLYLGGISYSFYLFHGLLLRLGRPIGFALPFWEGAAVILLFASLLSMLLATLVFEYVERPAVKISHRLMHGLRARAGGAAA
ncbi:acyltransferase [Sphingomonas sp.]|uniref:acyltransferase family protein n=1 Tax=Sphingomonas sp. TaxID=28214 RepID=UPI0026001DA0|nr:acyltransferase [Sphingomonas sp.]